MNYPIIDHLLIDSDTVKSVSGNTEGAIPLYDIPTITDYEWQAHALNSRIIYPERYQTTEDVPAVVARLRAWLDTHTQ